MGMIRTFNLKESGLRRLIAVTGHFGSGKTNVAVNLALRLREETGKPVTLIDLDIVNPYFRAADSVSELEAAGVKCILPEFANTNVDIPSLPPAILSVFDGSAADSYAVFDVGGDDTGAAALGGYRHMFARGGYDMLFVCSMFRPLTPTAAETFEYMREIEQRSGMKCTALVNNSSIGVSTERSTLASTDGYIGELSKLSGLPVLFASSVLRDIDPPAHPVFFMDNITKNIYGG